jgi:small-conductance mechanosensitive channel
MTEIEILYIGIGLSLLFGAIWVTKKSSFERLIKLLITIIVGGFFLFVTGPFVLLFVLILLAVWINKSRKGYDFYGSGYPYKELSWLEYFRHLLSGKEREREW